MSQCKVFHGFKVLKHSIQGVHFINWWSFPPEIILAKDYTYALIDRKIFALNGSEKRLRWIKDNYKNTQWINLETMN